MKSILKKSNLFYTIFFFLLLGFCFDNYMTVGPGLKVFYFFFPLLLAFYLFKRKFFFPIEIKLVLMFVMFQVISLIDTIILYPEAVSQVLVNVRRIIVIFATLFMFFNFYLKNERYFINSFLIIIFISAVANMLYYIFIYDFKQRFQGVFGGPNEFGFTMGFFIYAIYYSFYRFPKTKLKLLSIISLVLLHILIFVTLSRSAILGLVIFYFFSLPYFHRKIKLWKKIVIFIILIILPIKIYEMFSKVFQLVIERFTDSEGSKSLHSRVFEIEAGINLLSNHPFSLFFGNGMGITSVAEVFERCYEGLEGGLGTRIHNSFFATIVESGLLSFFNLLSILFILGKNIFLLKNTFKFVMIGFLFYIAIFLNAIYMLYFLPFWLGIFLLISHIHVLKSK